MPPAGPLATQPAYTPGSYQLALTPEEEALLNGTAVPPPPVNVVTTENSASSTIVNPPPPDPYGGYYQSQAPAAAPSSGYATEPLGGNDVYAPAPSSSGYGWISDPSQPARTEPYAPPPIPGEERNAAGLDNIQHSPDLNTRQGQTGRALDPAFHPSGTETTPYGVPTEGRFITSGQPAVTGLPQGRDVPGRKALGGSVPGIIGYAPGKEPPGWVAGENAMRSRTRQPAIEVEPPPGPSVGDWFGAEWGKAWNNVIAPWAGNIHNINPVPATTTGAEFLEGVANATAPADEDIQRRARLYDTLNPTDLPPVAQPSSSDRPGNQTYFDQGQMRIDQDVETRKRFQQEYAAEQAWKKSQSPGPTTPGAGEAEYPRISKERESDIFTGPAAKAAAKNPKAPVFRGSGIPADVRTKLMPNSASEDFPPLPTYREGDMGDTAAIFSRLMPDQKAPVFRGSGVPADVRWNLMPAEEDFASIPTYREGTTADTAESLRRWGNSRGYTGYVDRRLDPLEASRAGINQIRGERIDPFIGPDGQPFIINDKGIGGGAYDLDATWDATPETPAPIPRQGQSGRAREPQAPSLPDMVGQWGQSLADLLPRIGSGSSATATPSSSSGGSSATRTAKDITIDPLPLQGQTGRATGPSKSEIFWKNRFQEQADSEGNIIGELALKDLRDLGEVDEEGRWTQTAVDRGKVAPSYKGEKANYRHLIVDAVPRTREATDADVAGDVPVTSSSSSSSSSSSPGGNNWVDYGSGGSSRGGYSRRSSGGGYSRGGGGGWSSGGGGFGGGFPDDFAAALAFLGDDFMGGRFKGMMGGDGPGSWEDFLEDLDGDGEFSPSEIRAAKKKARMGRKKGMRTKGTTSRTSSGPRSASSSNREMHTGIRKDVLQRVEGSTPPSGKKKKKT